MGVVSPGFAVRPGALEPGLRALERFGFTPVIGFHARGNAGYFAGSDEERLTDLAGMLADPEIRAVWFARGGYGTARLLDHLRRKRLPREPKPILGYSDATALFSSVLRANGQVCLYAPVVAELGDAGAFHAASLRKLLRGETATLRFPRRRVVRGGRARGRLVGGNLTVLAHLAGTRHFPPTDGAILVLEDVGEETYRLDRLFQHLRMAGALRRVAGVCLGSFDPPAPSRSYPPDRPLAEVIEEVFADLGVPVVEGLPFGHVEGKWTLPLGGRAVLDTAAGTLAVTPRFGR